MSQDFIRGPARVMVAPADWERTEISDLVVLEEGEQQYDCVPPWADFGATRTGFLIIDDYERGERKINTQIAEKLRDDIRDFIGLPCTLAFLYQDKRDGSIRGRIFEQVQLQDQQWGPGQYGEASSFPVVWLGDVGREVIER